MSTTTKVLKKRKKTREESIMELFGPDGKNISAESLTYVRKNPKRFVKKISKIYGLDRVNEWLNN